MVHRKLKRIARARAALDVHEAAALREAQALHLWRRYGCASLLEYMERELGYTPRAAIERLRVAHAIKELPAVAEALRRGVLSYSAARELTRVATPDTELEWIAATSDLNLRQVEELVSGHRPGDRPTDPADPSLRTKVLRFEVRMETFALLRQAQQILQRERGEHLDDDGLVAALCRRVIDGVASEERTQAPYQVAVTVCDTCKRGWQDGGGVTVEMSRSAIERAQCDAQDIGAISDSSAPRARATQTVPPSTRRAVLRRDHGRCRVPGCRSSHNLDIHHIVSRERGGDHDPPNLVTLCEGHHLALHEGTLAISGSAPALVFRRIAGVELTAAARTLETLQALRGLGFTPQQAKEAVAAARTHVGTADVPIEDWIKTALRYCRRAPS